MAATDYIVVGSGINGLVCAALLGKKGKRVLLLERNPEIGGCIRTEEIIAPGFVHDVMATTFVLFVTSPGYAVLAQDLARHGVEFCDVAHPSGVLLPDGRSHLLSRDRAANARAFDALAQGDGLQHLADMGSVERDAGLLFTLLGSDLWSWPTAKLLMREAWSRGPRGLAAFVGETMVTARAWLEAHYRSEVSRAMWAPWVLHTGLGPESAYSGQMGKVIAFATEAAGTPIVKGGAGRLLEAFRALVEEQAGEIRCNADVEAVLLDGSGAADGVRLGTGEAIEAPSGVICSMAPQQLYNRLLGGQPLPPAVTHGLSAYRYGKGNMQIHYALDRLPQWRSRELGQVALLHLTPGLDGVSKAANECERGMLPETPTICLGQPHALDPSRCPPGKAILWLQLPEAPRHIKGDAAGRIAPPADGNWTEEIRERYADRVEDILVSHLPELRETVIGRKCYSPADLETLNVNLVGGDPYGGFCGLDQFFLWRPFKSTVNHRTHVPRLYHIGAATHPGAGLGGVSGYLMARSLEP